MKTQDFMELSSFSTERMDMIIQAIKQHLRDLGEDAPETISTEAVLELVDAILSMEEQ